MKLYITSIGDIPWTNVEHVYVDPIGTLTIEKLKERKEHNQAMLEIASAFSYS